MAALGELPVKMELFLTGLTSQGMASERYWGQGGGVEGGSGKVESPRGWRCPSCGTGAVLEWRFGCCSCLVLSPSLAPSSAQAGPGTNRMGVGGGTAAPSWDFVFPPTFHSHLWVFFSLGCCNGVLLFWILLCSPVPGDTPGRGLAQPSLPWSCGMSRELRDNSSKYFWCFLANVLSV